MIGMRWKALPCRDHELMYCTHQRCWVLALCYADLRERASGEEDHRMWCERHGYTPWPKRPYWDGPTLNHVQRAVAEQVAARLVSWMRWRGERHAGPVAPWFVGAGYSIDSDEHWQDGPGFWHPLDELASHDIRVRTLAIRMRGLQSVRQDGIDWLTVSVFLDGLIDLGWSFQCIHELAGYPEFITTWVAS